MLKTDSVLKKENRNVKKLKLLNWMHPRYSNFGQSQLSMDPPRNIAIA